MSRPIRKKGRGGTTVHFFLFRRGNGVAGGMALKKKNKQINRPGGKEWGETKTQQAGKGEPGQTAQGGFLRIRSGKVLPPLKRGGYGAIVKFGTHWEHFCHIPLSSPACGPPNFCDVGFARGDRGENGPVGGTHTMGGG